MKPLCARRVDSASVAGVATVLLALAVQLYALRRSVLQSATVDSNVTTQAAAPSSRFLILWLPGCHGAHLQQTYVNRPAFMQNSSLDIRVCDFYPAPL